MNTRNIYKQLYYAFITGTLIFFGFLLEDWLSTGRITNSLWLYYLSVMVFSVPLQVGNVLLVFWLDDLISWETKPVKRVIVGVVAALVLTMILLFFINMFFQVVMSGRTLEAYISGINFSYFSRGLYITVTAILFTHAYFFFKELQATKLSEARLRAENISAKYNSLKSQIDPHFLFNSLNVLYALVEENPKNAQKFIHSMSNVYRYVLEQKDKNLITLDEEIDFAEKYLELLKFRFEDALRYEINISGNKSQSIVPLSVQLLLENAVKHNAATDERPLSIEIYDEENYLVVKNNLSVKAVVERSTKIGLDSIEKRYQLLTDLPVSIEKTTEEFIVRIPLLEEQNEDKV